jgi:hypothetical protein
MADSPSLIAAAKQGGNRPDGRGRICTNDLLGESRWIIRAENCENEIDRSLPAAVLGDDMGFSDIGCFGSEIPTPNLDALAADGLKFTNFHNTSRCCPSRATLLTGLYAHEAGVGLMTGGGANMTPSYEGYLNRQCVTEAEVLQPFGVASEGSGRAKT